MINEKLTNVAGAAPKEGSTAPRSKIKQGGKRRQAGEGGEGDGWAGGGVSEEGGGRREIDGERRRIGGRNFCFACKPCRRRNRAAGERGEATRSAVLSSCRRRGGCAAGQATWTEGGAAAQVGAAAGTGGKGGRRRRQKNANFWPCCRGEGGGRRCSGGSVLPVHADGRVPLGVLLLELGPGHHGRLAGEEAARGALRRARRGRAGRLLVVVHGQLFRHVRRRVRLRAAHWRDQ